jgi:hypothetical protein
MRSCPSVLAAAITLVSAAGVSAQGTNYIRLSGSMSQVYDANLFAAPSQGNPQSDFVSRIGPALEMGYRSAPLEVGVRYGVVAERYAQHQELNHRVAGQDGGLLLIYSPSPRLTINADASYIETQTPGEFNIESRLAVGRSPAERLAVVSSVAYELSARNTTQVEYLFAKDGLVRDTSTRSSTLRARWTRRALPLGSGRVTYQVRAVDFTDPILPPSREYLQAITWGWAYDITPLMLVEIDAGPHVTSEGVRPDLAVHLRYTHPRGGFAITYDRTQITSIGEVGIIDSQLAALPIDYRANRRVSFNVTPAFSLNTQDRVEVPVYSVDGEALVEATPQLSVVFSGRFGWQDGTFDATWARIYDRRVSATLIVTVPRRSTVPQDEPLR